MTENEQQEFNRLKEENAEFKKAISLGLKAFSIFKEELGLDIAELSKIRSLEEVMVLLPKVMSNFQINIGGAEEAKERFAFLAEITPIFEKMKANFSINEQIKTLA